VRNPDEDCPGWLVVQRAKCEMCRAGAQRLKFAGGVDEDHLSGKARDALCQMREGPALAGPGCSNDREVATEKTRQRD
jgi:hypothetical protein